MSLLRRRMMILVGLESEEEVKEVGTVVTNPDDGSYGSITFSLPHSEGIHYYLFEQTDVETNTSNRLIPAALLRYDCTNEYCVIVLVNPTVTNMAQPYKTDFSDNFNKNEDGTFTFVGNSSYRFNVPITYHIYHLAEGKV